MTSMKLKRDEETSDEAMLHMDVEQIPVVPTILSEAQFEDEEPMVKRQRMNDADTISMDDSVKAILFNINKAISCRLDSMERKLTNLHNTCYKMGRKMDNLNFSVIRALSRIKELEKTAENGSTSPGNTVVIGFPPEEDHNQVPSTPQSPISQSISRNVTLITLNTEDDFPNGCWLGDDGNMECRVRCGISQADMLHVMQTAKTPEKCALKLLDYLFDRETQASSNLSGTGKHGKKQLNPLMIYGLRCHLIKHFGITDTEWHRIRMNIDSKCRTAFRRKQRGLPMTVKAFGYKTGSADLDDSFGEREDLMNDSHSSEDGSHSQGVHIQLPVDSHIAEIPQEVDQHHHQQDGNTVIKGVRIKQDVVPLHEGQINITQSGEIQIAVMEELEGATTTLVLQQQSEVIENHHKQEEVVVDEPQAVVDDA